jgi:hypothetical protein
MRSAAPTGAVNLGPGSVFNVDSAEKSTFPCLIPNPESRIQRPDAESSLVWFRKPFGLILIYPASKHRELARQLKELATSQKINSA